MSFLWDTWWKDINDGTRQGVLAVQDINFCIESNGETHHTSKYAFMSRPVDRSLVVRRGQPFTLNILLNRPFDANRDAISFIFNVSGVEKRGPSSDTSVAVPMLDKGSETLGAWSAVYEGQMDSHIIVEVTAGVDCMVAEWNIEVDTRLTGGSSLSYTHPLPVYILFNPWCLTDTVYMPGHEHREEYVEQDGGLLFTGGYNAINYMPWNGKFELMSWSYAQYEKNVLKWALYLVSEIGKVKGRARGDPIQTIRALSAALNEEDDNGVLVGNWTKKFDGGISPSYWVGSLAILQEYFKEKKPVKYAQCWVYAGVFTTICRALGIPCRPVTGYNAAHDSQGSLTIDIIKDDTGKTLQASGVNDNIWNFHVWNETWMKRPDLGAEYGGWQAVDATPQETSEDMYRCGPASLRAVRDGELQRPYDCTYIFAQVNADYVIWKYSGTHQPLKFLARDTTSICERIVTKEIGKMGYEDITNLYKYPEKTLKERETMEKALSKSKNIFARYYLNDDFNEDIQFNIELPDDIKIGQDFTVVLHIKNRSLVELHQVKGVLRVDAVTYTGKTRDSVKRTKFNRKVEPDDKEQVTMLITFDEYHQKLVDQDQGSFNITCLASIVETQFDLFTEAKFRVQIPDIEIALEGKPKSQQEVNVTVQVENPLPIPLINGKFYIHGPGLDRQLKLELSENVAPGAVGTVSFKYTPPWAGRLQISAKFTSKEIKHVNGFLSFKVAPPNTNGYSSDVIETEI